MTFRLVRSSALIIVTSLPDSHTCVPTTYFYISRLSTHCNYLPLFEILEFTQGRNCLSSFFLLLVVHDHGIDKAIQSNTMFILIQYEMSSCESKSKCRFMGRLKGKSAQSPHYTDFQAVVSLLRQSYQLPSCAIQFLRNITSYRSCFNDPSMKSLRIGS